MTCFSSRLGGTGKDAAVAAHAAVAREGAPEQRGGSGVKDGPAVRLASFDGADGLVADESAARGGESASVIVGDGPTPGVTHVVLRCGVVGQHVVGEQQRATGVQDAAATISPRPAVGDGQAGDGDGVAFADVEDPVDVAAADGQEACSGPLDVQALVDCEL